MRRGTSRTPAVAVLTEEHAGEESLAKSHAPVCERATSARNLCSAVTAPCGRREQDGLDICRWSCRSPQWSCRSPRCIPWLADVLLGSSLYVGGGGGAALYVSPAHHAGEDQGAVRKRPLQRGGGWCGHRGGGQLGAVLWHARHAGGSDRSGTARGGQYPRRSGAGRAAAPRGTRHAAAGPRGAPCPRHATGRCTSTTSHSSPLAFQTVSAFV